MERKNGKATIMIAMLLMMALMATLPTVKASETIYIRADGSIGPPTAPIYTADNITYTLTDNITSDTHGIVVERDNIVINGDEYTLQGTGALESKGIDLSGRINVTVQNTQIKNFYSSIWLYYSNYNSVSGNNITANNHDGIRLYSSSYNSMSGNSITNNVYGILLGYSSNNSISGNSITNNLGGIYAVYSSYNSMSGNDIANNDDGIWLRESSYYNNISGNNIAANNVHGIWLDYSSSNIIYHNNFIGNSQQYRVDSSGYANVWDDGYPSGGNYWSDYNGTDLYSGPYQNETGSDGIGDTLYIIEADNQDNYPLMGAWTIEGGNITVTPSGDVAITFENVTSSGITTLNISQVGPDPPSGFKLATETPTYYDIKTTANYTGPIQIRIAYNDTGLTQDQENNLQLMHWNETQQQWIDIATYIDTEKNVIYGETSHFSIFTVMLSPNIATMNIAVSKTVIGQGYSVIINMTVENQGGYAETFNVTIYANTTIIETKEVTLTSENSTTLTFTWNTTGFTKGHYTISAYTEPVPGETDIEDNTFVNGLVSVSIPGDMDGNLKVQLVDLVILAKAYCSKPGDPNWNPNADIDNNGHVSLVDLVIVAIHYGETYP